MTDHYLSYRDMYRIKDAIVAEGPKILGIDKLPKEIISGLELACSIVDPSEVSFDEFVKNLKSVGIGGAGLWLLIISLGTILNPGIVATASVFLFGGIAAGPFMVAGAVGGLSVLCGSVIYNLKKIEPEERSIIAHKFVNQYIDQWSGEVGLKQLEHTAKNLIRDKSKEYFVKTKDLTQELKAEISNIERNTTKLLNKQSKDFFAMMNDIKKYLNEDISKLDFNTIKLFTEKKIKHIKNFLKK